MISGRSGSTGTASHKSMLSAWPPAAESTTTSQGGNFQNMMGGIVSTVRSNYVESYSA